MRAYRNTTDNTGRWLETTGVDTETLQKLIEETVSLQWDARKLAKQNERWMTDARHGWKQRTMTDSSRR